MPRKKIRFLLRNYEPKLSMSIDDRNESLYSTFIPHTSQVEIEPLFNGPYRSGQASKCSKNSLFQYSRLNVDYQASPTLLRIIDQCLNNKNGFQHRFPSSRSRNRKPFQPTEKPVAEILVKCTGRYAYLIR